MTPNTSLPRRSDDLDNYLLICLSVPVIRRIESLLTRIGVSIIHNSLTISSEDALCSHICSRVSSNHEYTMLFQFLQFEYLSPECVRTFVAMNPIPVSLPLWQGLSQRLVSGVGVEFPLDTGRPLDGIISYLKLIYGVHATLTKMVTITASSRWRGYLTYLLDFSSDSRYLTLAYPNGWLCWDFQELRLRPTHYTIWSLHLKSWVVEGSLDGANWTEIDRRTNTNEFIQPGGIASFPISKLATCRFIRLTQTGPNHAGGWVIIASAFEFFGDIYNGQSKLSKK
jgi:hypothetical protein